ncbi:hypothetical protein KCP69_17030 [Salmonella enterica subsp. enterica]|nr:hypothetical protein KCP69_17030 [Salmonella enterica subsp. enterica]
MSAQFCHALLNVGGIRHSSPGFVSKLAVLIGKGFALLLEVARNRSGKLLIGFLLW